MPPPPIHLHHSLTEIGLRLDPQRSLTWALQGGPDGGSSGPEDGIGEGAALCPEAGGERIVEPGLGGVWRGRGHDDDVLRLHQARESK